MLEGRTNFATVFFGARGELGCGANYCITNQAWFRVMRKMPQNSIETKTYNDNKEPANIGRLGNKTLTQWV